MSAAAAVRSSGGIRVLLVDLNNFARYPTLSIGYLAATLRAAGHHVSVFAPLMVGVRGVAREARTGRFGLLASKLNYRAAVSRRSWIRSWRDRLASRARSGITRQRTAVLEGFRERLARDRPEVVLISTYLMYRDACEEICDLCRRAGIPTILSGPYFVQPEVIGSWARIPGLSALASGELESTLPEILVTLRSGGDLSRHAGVFRLGADGGLAGTIAPPLQDLDRLPFPDFSDFEWSLYPNRIVPVITGRGCGWGACTFCSDVTSTAGRSYRSRSPRNVTEELRTQHRRCGATRFVFTDLKLNSDVGMWRAVAAGMQEAVPGGEWIASVHVASDGDNGLSESDLRAAARSGCVRLTTGLESGSQRVNDSMRKGTRLEDLGAFFRRASSAGISCRCTMILGYPGERAEDVEASAEFLEAHRGLIERVSLNRMQIVMGTTLHRSLRRGAVPLPRLTILGADESTAQVSHRDDETSSPSHRRAVMRLLEEVHRANSRDLSPRAREFEGVM